MTSAPSDDARARLLAMENEVDEAARSRVLLALPRQAIAARLHAMLWQIRHGRLDKPGPATGVEDTEAYSNSARMVSRMSLIADLIMAAPVQPGLTPAAAATFGGTVSIKARQS